MALKVVFLSYLVEIQNCEMGDLFNIWKIFLGNDVDIWKPLLCTYKSIAENIYHTASNSCSAHCREYILMKGSHKLMEPGQTEENHEKWFSLAL
jgi:hypothetical protein